jgi:hypothetical protein
MYRVWPSLLFVLNVSNLPLSCVQADFMNIPQPDNSYDAIYEIEATCHAPEPVSTVMPCSNLGAAA